MHAQFYNPDVLASSMEKARASLSLAERLVVFTGAGISVDSGISTFRDDKGLWSRFPPAQFSNWNGILQLARTDPKRLGEFLVTLLKPIAVAKPNAGHISIAALEKRVQDVSVVTQNIDGLHQLAGSSKVFEIHGTAFELIKRPRRAETAVEHISRNELYASIDKLENLCAQTSSSNMAILDAIKPILEIGMGAARHLNIVLFGDDLPPKAWEDSLLAAERCDYMLIIGTSQLVTPASSLPEIARKHGAKIILVDPTHFDCDIWLGGGASEILPKLLEFQGG